MDHHEVTPAARKAEQGKRGRRGATMVLIAILMTVLMMFAAFGIDFGRMYTFSAQLKVLTDAASMAGAITLRDRGTQADAQTRAVALRNVNTVAGLQIADMQQADIEPGTWDFANRAFVPGPWSSATAVRATARHTANWSLARVFGVTNRALTQRSVAAVGSQISSECLKPFGIPYRALLNKVEPNGSLPLSHNLTPTQIASLTTNQTPIRWSQNDNLGADTPPGGFSLVGFEPLATNLSNNTFLETVIPPGCRSGRVAVGDSLPSITGVGQGNVLPHLRTLCPSGNNGNQQNWTCANPVNIQVPIYDRVTGTGNNAKYIVKYIGAYTMTGVDFRGNTQDIYGFLTRLGTGTGGSVSPIAGPVQVAIIVQ